MGCLGVGFARACEPMRVTFGVVCTLGEVVDQVLLEDGGMLLLENGLRLMLEDN